MYIPAAEMGEYDSWKPPPQKKTSSKQPGVDRQPSRGKMTGGDHDYAETAVINAVLEIR